MIISNSSNSNNYNNPDCNKFKTLAVETQCKYIDQGYVVLKSAE